MNIEINETSFREFTDIQVTYEVEHTEVQGGSDNYGNFEVCSESEYEISEVWGYQNDHWIFLENLTYDEKHFLTNEIIKLTV